MSLSYHLKRSLFLLRKRRLTAELLAQIERKRRAREEKILPEIDLRELIPGDADLTLLEAEVVDGNVSLDELRAIASLVAHFRPKRIFEIGTFDGRTTLNMAAHAPRDCEVVTLDLPQSNAHRTELRLKTGDLKFVNKPRSGVRFVGTPYERMIRQIYADSGTFDYSALEGTVDFVFVDGSHSYEYVVSDTNHCRRLLRGGKGVLLWHDYSWHEVVRALNEFYLNDRWFAQMRSIKGTSLAILVKS